MTLGGEKASYRLGVFFKVLLALLLSFFLLNNGLINGFIIPYGSQRGWILPILGVYVVLLACVVALYLRAREMRREWLIAIIVFAFALILRLVVFAMFRVEPASDFESYYKYGFYIRNGNLHDAAMLIADYQQPKMGGLALFNGVLCFIFTDTVIGQQLAHVVLSSLIVPALYFAARRLGKKPAVLASLLYAIYPSSLISAQLVSNQHGATVFFLVAICFFIESLRQKGIVKKLIFAAISAIFLTVSDFIHSSAIIVLIAMGLVTLVVILRDRGLRWQNLAALALSAAMFFSLGALGLQALYKMHVIYDTRSITPLFKVLMGFNPYSRGGYSGDYNYIKNIPFEEQSSLALRMTWDRLRAMSGEELFALISEKSNTAWFDNDLYFHFFYWDALDVFNDKERLNELSEAERAELMRRIDFTDGMQAMDNLFLLIIYLLAIAGLLSRLRKKDGETLLISVLIPLGWMLFIMISEVQSRYRYPAMPFYMLLASAGAIEMTGRLRAWVRRGRKA